MYSTANLSDKELKEQGNRLFSLRRYEDATNCYTKAIVSIFLLTMIYATSIPCFCLLTFSRIIILFGS